MMILHTMALTVLSVVQMSQAPIVVQCVQKSEPESLVKLLLPTIIQTIVSLASITAGVLIAVASFRANSRKEHEQWVRDQKKAEWKELLGKAAEIERVLPTVSMSRMEKLLKVATRLKRAASELSKTRASSVFLLGFFEIPDNLNRFTSFIKEADHADSYIWAYSEAIDTDLTSENLEEGILKITHKIEETKASYSDFVEWLRRAAANDLGIATSKQPLRHGERSS
jgi:hypothetical protein